VTPEIRIKEERSPNAETYHHHSNRAYEVGPTHRVGLGRAVSSIFNAYVSDMTDPVGGLCCYAVFDFMVIEAMWVNPEFQKLGIGRELILAARALAERCSCQRILASTMSFHGAMPFLRKVGFEVIAEVEDCPKGASLYYIQIKLPRGS
jgi:GNAT superfamily N-acetyltransferase